MSEMWYCHTPELSSQLHKVCKHYIYTIFKTVFLRQEAIMGNIRSWLNRCLFLLPISIHAFKKKKLTIIRIVKYNNSYFMGITVFMKIIIC